MKRETAIMTLETWRAALNIGTLFGKFDADDVEIIALQKALEVAVKDMSYVKNLKRGKNK